MNNGTPVGAVPPAPDSEKMRMCARRDGGVKDGGNVGAPGADKDAASTLVQATTGISQSGIFTGEGASVGMGAESLSGQAADGAGESSARECDGEPIEKYSFKMTARELAEVHSGAFRVFYVALLVVASLVSGIFIDNAYTSGNGLFGGWAVMAAVYTVVILMLVMIRKGREKQIIKSLELDDELTIFDRYIEYRTYKGGVLKRFFKVESEAVESVSCTDRIFSFISEGILYSIPRRVLVKNSRISDVVRAPSVNGVAPKNPMLCRSMPTFLLMTVYTLLPLSLANIMAVDAFASVAWWLPLVFLGFALISFAICFLSRLASRSISGILLVAATANLIFQFIFTLPYIIGALIG